MILLAVIIETSSQTNSFSFSTLESDSSWDLMNDPMIIET